MMIFIYYLPIYQPIVIIMKSNNIKYYILIQNAILMRMISK